MQMGMDTPLSDARSIDAALERLRHDLFGTRCSRSLRGARRRPRRHRLRRARVRGRADAQAPGDLGHLHDLHAGRRPQLARGAAVTDPRGLRQDRLHLRRRAACATSCWTCGKDGHQGKPTTEQFEGAWPSSSVRCCSWRRPSVPRTPTEGAWPSSSVRCCSWRRPSAATIGTLVNQGAPPAPLTPGSATGRPVARAWQGSRLSRSTGTGTKGPSSARRSAHESAKSTTTGAWSEGF